MRALIVLALVLLVLVGLGWLKVSNNPQQTTISVDKEAVRHDTATVLERSAELAQPVRSSVGNELGPDSANRDAEQAAPSDGAIR
jgi:hypothetical protein